jgi:hypothetical protein
MPVARTLRLHRFPFLALWLSGVFTCAMPAIAMAFPGVTILGPTRGPTYETILPNVTMSGEAYEFDASVASVAWRSDRVIGGGTIPFTPPVITWMGVKISTWTAENIPLVLGVNNITITVTNDRGDSAWRQLVVTMTNTPPPGLPSIEITGPSATGSYAASEREVSIAGKADDPGGGVTAVSWSSDRIPGSLDACGFDYPAAHVTWRCTVVLMAGANTIRVIATDYDNQTAEDTIVITVADPPVAPGTPVVHITSPLPGPNGVFETTSALLNVEAVMSDPDGPLTGILWRSTFPGFLLSDSVGTPPSSSFTWWKPGVMLIRGVNHIMVSASDGQGNTGTDHLIVFRTQSGPAGPPTVAITSPTSSGSYAATTTMIALSGSASDPNGSVINVHWDSDRFPQEDSPYTPPNVRMSLAGEQVTWTASDIPLAPGVNHIIVTATDDEYNITTTAIAVTVNELTYYLAEGATGFFTFDLLLGNPNDVEAPVTLQFLDQDGPLPPLTRVLPAKSRTTIRVNDLPGMQGRSVSTVVTSTSALPLMVERTMFWDSRAYGAATDHASEALSTKWYFAEGAQGFFRTYILLANPHPTANVAHVTYFREGAGPVSKDYPLKAWARDTIDIGKEPELRFQAFGTEVTFDQPGVAERAMYFGGPPQWLGGHESAGVTEPSRDWFLAEGATGDYWVTFALFANPSATETAHVDVNYLRPSGEPVKKTYEIGPQQRRSFNIAAEDPLLKSTAVGTEVHSDIPILVERAQYWGGHSPDSWLESHNSFGVTVPAKKWGLAEGRLGGPSKFQSYILIANPSFLAANVTVTFLREAGKPSFSIGPFVVDAKNRRTVFGDVPVENFGDESFSAVITSDVPIVVERAMYSDALGQHWKAGTNATATRLP